MALAGLGLVLANLGVAIDITRLLARCPLVSFFVSLARTIPFDPTSPLSTRTLINVVKGGDTLVIFPQRCITVTGALKKIFEGPGMEADKANAPLVPVRLEGLVRPRRYRHPGRSGLCVYPGAGQAFCEDRGRDGLPGHGGSRGSQTLARVSARGGGPPGPKKASSWFL